MCGIAGIALKPNQSIEPWQIERLTQCLHHRGPDGQGIWQNEAAVLLHTRLSILDLDHGQQPLQDENNIVTVVNGEIYNDPDIREIFKVYPFKTTSDSESVLPLWKKFHDQFTHHLRGMYAIAIIDMGQGSVILSRDPLGIKPLYYSITDKGIAFASEPIALIKAGLVTLELESTVVETTLQLQFCPGQQTIFKSIRRLSPGETLIIHQGEIIRNLTQSLFPNPVSTTKINNIDQAIKAFDGVFQNSVESHLRSDVPLGLFLSSGIDSAILLKMMARLGKANKLQAWTARFEIDNVSAVHDETILASKLAHMVGARHHCFTITQAMVWQYLPQIIAAMDDPVMDYAIIPTWFLAKEASQSVKVILSGEGGDELFAGYGRYRKASRPWWQGFRKKLYTKSIFNSAELSFEPPCWRHPVATLEQQIESFPFSNLEQAQMIDIKGWLADDLLLKLDRCLMVHSVEGRVPFLDKEVVEFAFSLGDKLKIKDRQGKWILRKWLEHHFPQADPFAPKKGFTVPIGAWIEQAAPQLSALVMRQKGIKEIDHHLDIKHIFAHASKRKERQQAWNLLFYALWHQIHVMGNAPTASTFELLAA